MIRKIKSDDTQEWMTAVAFRPIIKSLSVDLNEQFVCFGGYASMLDVVWILANTGRILDAQRQYVYRIFYFKIVM